MKSNIRKTYLSRVQSDYFTRKWYRRSVTLFCTLLFAAKWMRKAQTIRCLVLEISEGGATVRIGKAEIPNFVYLVFGRFDVVVGSIVVQRDPGHLHLCFLKQLRPDFVNRLSRVTSPFATLESLDPITISGGENTQRALRPKPPSSYGDRSGGLGQPTKHSRKP